MARKLSKTQRDVLKEMAEGWALWWWHDYGGHYLFLDHTNRTEKDTLLAIRRTTGQALLKNGWITSVEHDWRRDKYTITPAGRAAAKEKK